MALSALTVLEVRVGGDDTNGGGFVTGASGTDWSQQNAAQYSVTDGVTAGTTTITSATAAFGTDVVGNLIYVQGGTGVVVGNWYQIISRTNATTIVVDRVTGLTAGTGVTLHIGGALKTVGQSAAVNNLSSGIQCFIKNEGSIFPITSVSTNVANGTMAVSAAVSIFIGYATNRSFGNTDAAPTIQTQVNAATQSSGSLSSFYNIIFDGNNGGGFTGSKHCSGGVFTNCLITNFNTVSSGSPMFKNCGATTNSVSVFAGTCIDCQAWANTGTPYNILSAIRCTSVSNTGSGFTQAGNAILESCVSVSNTVSGFAVAGGNTAHLINCIAESNTGVGFAQANGSKTLINCASYNNSARSSGTFSDLNPITTPSSVLVSAPTDLSLNNTAGAGALLRATSFPTVSYDGLTLNYRDIGAFQSQASAGSAGMLFVPNLDGI